MAQVLSLDDLSLGSAKALANALSSALDAGGGVLVEASPATRVDIAGLQALISAHGAATALGVAFEVACSPASAIADALARFGFMGSDGVAHAPFHLAEAGGA